MPTTEAQPARFRVRLLSAKNYRRFENFEFHPGNVNVLVGVNGAGKSAALQALAIGLSRLTARIATGRAGGLQIPVIDIRNAETFALLAIQLSNAEGLFHQVTRRVRPGRKVPRVNVKSGTDEMIEVERSVGTEKSGTFASIADGYRERLTSDDQASLPVVALYGVNRAVLDVPLRIRTRHTFDQLAAYDGALQAQRNFRTFFEWFREREDLENELRAEDPKFRDSQLNAVRRAIQGLMERYDDLRVRRSPLRMTIKKGEDELLVNQLSDGEKALLALAGDLARRAALANPGLQNPLEGEGVVMVDEVDLHLHPSWQRRIVQQLPQVFPNIQFFLTTHSPIIASTVHSDCLWVLQDGYLERAEAYGQDVSLVLSDVFQTTPRLEAVQAELDELFMSIRDGDMETATNRLRSLEVSIGQSDPQLVRARTLLHGLRAS